MFSASNNVHRKNIGIHPLTVLSSNVQLVLNLHNFDINATPLICDQIETSSLPRATKEMLISRLFIDYQIIIPFLCKHTLANHALLDRILNITSTDHLTCLSRSFDSLLMFNDRGMLEIFINRYMANPEQFAGVADCLVCVNQDKYKLRTVNNIKKVLGCSEARISMAFCMKFVTNQNDFDLLMTTYADVDLLAHGIMRGMRQLFPAVNSAALAILQEIDEEKKCQIFRNGVEYARTGKALFMLFNRQDGNAISGLPREAVAHIAEQLTYEHRFGL